MAVNRFTPAFAGRRPDEPTPAPPGPTISVEPLATLINGRRVRGQLQINGTTDPDPDVASVEIEWGDGTPRTTVAPPYNVVHEYAAEAVYEIRILAESVTQRRTVAGARVQALGDPTALPSASFTYSPLAIVAPGDVVQFDASASQPGTGGPITQYDWDWGDGSPLEMDAGVTPTHVFTATGQPRVSMQVTDQIGERDATSRVVIVQEPDPDPESPPDEVET